MKTIYRLAPLLVLILAMSGCQATSHVGPMGSSNGTVTHVVIMWMYDPGDLTARDEILGAGKTLEKIPGVVSVTGGKMLRSDRPVVDNSYDVAFVITFRNEEAMHTYLENPVHLDTKKNLLDRYVRKYQVYDFVAE